MTIILAIIFLAFILLAHELGHFFLAKLSKVKVEEFGFGFPPRIMAKKFGSTLYSLNWLPLGGFNKINEESFERQPPGRRILISRRHCGEYYFGLVFFRFGFYDRQSALSFDC